MKKIWSLVITFALMLAIFAPFADAKRVPVPTPMPNVYSKSVANKLKAGTYSFHGVKLGNKMSSVKKNWGIPTTKRISKLSTITIGNYNYGPIPNLKLVAQSSGRVAENSLKAAQIIISKKSPTKYEFKKVIRAFGKTNNIRTNGSVRFVTYTYKGVNTIMYFQKSGSKWYLYSLSSGKSV